MLTEILPGPVVILAGRVSDSLTGAGLPRAELAIDYRQGGDWKTFPVQPRVGNGGWYRCAANMRDILARVPVGVATEMRMTARTKGYQPVKKALSISAADFTVTTSTVQIGGENVEARSFAGGPFAIDVALAPLPVMLAGLVVSDNDLAAPVAGASVEITTAGGTTQVSGSDGRFRFDTIPMALTLDLKVTEGGRTTETMHVVDFNQPVNDVLVSLKTPPGP